MRRIGWRAHTQLSVLLSVSISRDRVVGAGEHRGSRAASGVGLLPEHKSATGAANIGSVEGSSLGQGQQAEGRIGNSRAGGGENRGKNNSGLHLEGRVVERMSVKVGIRREGVMHGE